MRSTALQVRDIRGSSHFWASNNLIRRDGAALGVYGIAVYCALAIHADNSSQAAYPSVTTLAHLIGCSPNKVRQAIKSLVERGWISVEEQRELSANGKPVNLTNVYYLLPTPDAGVLHQVKGGTSPGEVGVLHEVKGGTSPGEDELDSSNKTQVTIPSELDSAAPPATANAPTPAQKNSRKKDELYEAICLCVNNVSYDKASKGQLSRTGQFKRELLERMECKVAPPTPAEVRQFRQKYKVKCKGMDFPKDTTKFADWFVAIFRDDPKYRRDVDAGGTEESTPEDGTIAGPGKRWYRGHIVSAWTPEEGEDNTLPDV